MVKHVRWIISDAHDFQVDRRLSLDNCANARLIQVLHNFVEHVLYSRPKLVAREKSTLRLYHDEILGEFFHDTLVLHRPRKMITNEAKVEVESIPSVARTRNSKSDKIQGQHCSSCTYRFSTYFTGYPTILMPSVFTVSTLRSSSRLGRMYTLIKSKTSFEM